MSKFKDDYVRGIVLPDETVSIIARVRNKEIEPAWPAIMGLKPKTTEEEAFNCGVALGLLLAKNGQGEYEFYKIKFK